MPPPCQPPGEGHGSLAGRAGRVACGWLHTPLPGSGAGGVGARSGLRCSCSPWALARVRSALAAEARPRSRRERMTRSITTRSTISTHTPARAARSTDPASAPAPGLWGAAAGRRAGLCGRAGRTGWAGGWLADVMRAASWIARAASTVPYPAPDGERAGSGGKLVVLVTFTVLSVRACVTWAADRCGNLDMMSAATPATMPLAALVLLVCW